MGGRTEPVSVTTVATLVEVAPGAIFASREFGRPWHVLRLAVADSRLHTACDYDATGWSRSSTPRPEETGCANCLAALRRDGRGGVRAAAELAAEESRQVRAAVSTALRGRAPGV